MDALTGTLTDMPEAKKLNIDPREVAYYERLAATWWNRAGPFWPLHRLNELRTSYLEAVFARLFKRSLSEPRALHGLRILDVGCGGGLLSESMARLGADVCGIDVVQKNIEIARHHARLSALPVDYETTTVSELAARGIDYDIVLNMEVVEHVPYVPAFVQDCARLVRPGGVMALATINRTFLSWLFAIVGAEYILAWLPRGTHRWNQFVRPNELERLLEIDGFVVAEQSGVRVNPMSRRFTLTASMAVNYMLVAQRQPVGSCMGREPFGYRVPVRL